MAERQIDQQTNTFVAELDVQPAQRQGQTAQTQEQSQRLVQAAVANAPQVERAQREDRPQVQSL